MASGTATGAGSVSIRAPLRAPLWSSPGAGAAQLTHPPSRPDHDGRSRTTRGRRAENDGRPHAPGPRATTSATSTSVWRQDTVGKAMPVACRDREKALPDARWRAWIRGTPGGAQRQLQAWPLHRRDDRDPPLAERDYPRSFAMCGILCLCSTFGQQNLHLTVDCIPLRLATGERGLQHLQVVRHSPIPNFACPDRATSRAIPARPSTWIPLAMWRPWFDCRFQGPPDANPSDHSPAQ
jgi:hypothetical protein